MADVRLSTRLTESASCLVASENALDRQMERLLQGAERLQTAQKPIPELNPGHSLVKSAASVADDQIKVCIMAAS